MTDLLPFLPILIIFATLSAYYDVKLRKIPNWLIVFGLTAGILTHVAIAVKAYIVTGHLNVNYFRDQAMNMVFATLLAVLLYYLDLADAGDGKAIITYSILIPVSVYHKGYFYPYPGIVHVGISYLLAYISVIVAGLSSASFDDLKHTVKELFQPEQLGRMILAIVAFSQIFILIGQVIPAPKSPAVLAIYALTILMIFHTVPKKVFNALAIMGAAIYVYSLLGDMKKITLLLQAIGGALLLTVLFSPISVALKKTEGLKVPMGLFLAIGAVITILVVR